MPVSLSSAIVRGAIVATTCLAVAVAVPGVAAAAPASPSPSTAPPTLSQIQQKADAAIAQRLVSLGGAISAVGSNHVITSADRATLLATLTGDITGLTQLKATIAADTTVHQAAADAATIYTGYRVYVLALPQVRYAEAADDITGTVLPRLTDAQNALEWLVARYPAKDTAAVQAAMSDLAAKIAATTAGMSGLSATVLAYTPAQWDANHDLLDAPRQQLSDAQTDVSAARADIQTVVRAFT